MLSKWGFSLAFDNKFTANIYIYIYIYIYILGMREKKGGFSSHAGVLLSPITRYHNTDVWTFLKLMIMIEHLKWCKCLILTYSQCFFLDKWLIGPIQVNCFRMGYPRRKRQIGGGRGRIEDIRFWKKNLGIVLVFLCIPVSFR